MVLEGWGFDGLDVPAKTFVRPIEVGRAKANGPCQADFGGRSFAARIVEDLLLESICVCLFYGHCKMYIFMTILLPD